MPYKYKTKDGQEVVIPGVGQTKDGVIVSAVRLESPILEEIEAPDQTTAAPASAHLIGVVPQAQQGVPAPQPQPEQTANKETE